MTSRFVVPGGAATSVKAVPGGTFAMDFRVDAPATQTLGASFLLVQTVPAAPSGFFQIIARDFTASVYNDTASGTPDAVVLALPSALLNPTNDDNLGRNTIGFAGAAVGMNLFVETITFSVAAATPLGTYTIKPSSGGNSTVTDVALNDYDMSLTASFNVTVGQTLSVTKSGTGGGTVTSNVGVINCGAVCSDIYAGTTVTLTAAPNASSAFIGWSGGGCSGTGTCVVTVNAATTVNAQFDLTPQTLTVIVNGTGTGSVTSAPAGINCPGTCSFAPPGGSTVTLTATPAAGSTFAGWSGCGCSGTGTCVVTMSSAQSVTATFNVQTFTLTVIKPGTGAGTVTSAPAGINCGATCNFPYAFGTVVTLTAAPTAGSTFAGWSGGGCSGTGTCMVTMNAAATVNAQFDLGPQALGITLTGAGAGTVTSAPAGINCPGTCSSNFAPGTVVTLTAAAAAGSTFAGWSGGGCSGTGTCVVTINAATSVTAQFVVTPASLVNAVSRKLHGAAGMFDLTLSLVTPPTINNNPTTEPRQGPAHTIVFTFDKPINAATAGITEGGASAGAPSFNANSVAIGLTGVLDRQYVTVSLTNVTATDGSFGGNASVRLGFLAGDVNQNRVVTVADLGQVNAVLTQLVTAANYLNDVNANGALTVADKGVATSNLSFGLPAP